MYFEITYYYLWRQLLIWDIEILQYAIETGGPPIFPNLRRQPMLFEKKIDQLIHNLLESKIVWPCRRSWIKPLMIVGKTECCYKEIYLERIKRLFLNIGHILVKLATKLNCTWITMENGFQHDMWSFDCFNRKILDAPVPLCVTQIRAFMGLTNYYWRFIEDYAYWSPRQYAMRLKEQIKRLKGQMNVLIF